MNASPITTWEGAEAIFTFADSPGAITLILLLSVAATVGAIISTVQHEIKTYRDYQ